MLRHFVSAVVCLFPDELGSKARKAYRQKKNIVLVLAVLR
jgi:hypothetical protein